MMLSPWLKFDWSLAGLPQILSSDWSRLRAQNSMECGCSQCSNFFRYFQLLKMIYFTIVCKAKFKACMSKIFFSKSKLSVDLFYEMKPHFLEEIKTDAKYFFENTVSKVLCISWRWERRKCSAWKWPKQRHIWTN